MANWCNNRVEFMGEHSQFEQLAALFKGMAETEQRTGCGQLPPFMESEAYGFFFEIIWENGVLYYQTKWAPNTAVLVLIAEEYEVGFTYNYDEVGNGVFGEASYMNGNLTVIDLDADDIGQYEYDADNGTYRFENFTYESSEDILQLMLERKKATIRRKGLDFGIDGDF